MHNKFIILDIAILHYACTSLLKENNGKNNVIAMELCAVF